MAALSALLLHACPTTCPTLAPAMSSPTSSCITRLPARKAGSAEPSALVRVTMARASPSAMAVLPTPGSPSRMGLFFFLRARIWVMRSTSFCRPITCGKSAAGTGPGRHGDRRQRQQRQWGAHSSGAALQQAHRVCALALRLLAQVAAELPQRRGTLLLAVRGGLQAGEAAAGGCVGEQAGRGMTGQGSSGKSGPWHAASQRTATLRR